MVPVSSKSKSEDPKLFPHPPSQSHLTRSRRHLSCVLRSPPACHRTPWPMRRVPPTVLSRLYQTNRWQPRAFSPRPRPPPSLETRGCEVGPTWGPLRSLAALDKGSATDDPRGAIGPPTTKLRQSALEFSHYVSRLSIRPVFPDLGPSEAPHGPLPARFRPPVPDGPRGPQAHHWPPGPSTSRQRGPGPGKGSGTPGSSSPGPLIQIHKPIAPAPGRAPLPSRELNASPACETRMPARGRGGPEAPCSQPLGNSRDLCGRFAQHPSTEQIGACTQGRMGAHAMRALQFCRAAFRVILD